MTRPISSPTRSRKSYILPLWFERFMAVVILLNYLLILFDLSYIPFRDFWLQGRVQTLVKIGPFEQKIPPDPFQLLPISVAPWYDWVKGIEPYRSTEQYLERVDDLIQAIDPTDLPNIQGNTASNLPNQPNLTARSGDDLESILADLRQRSEDMIRTNPFQLANKTGALETLKNKMRLQVFGTTQASATQAFQTFWTKEYLFKNGLAEQLLFFNSQIRPLIEVNYFRAIAENGYPVDNFPLLDFPFFILFFADFLVRTRVISQNNKNVSWFDAMLWRWYDAFLLIPIFRWLRIIPLVIRLEQAQLINLTPVKTQFAQGFVAIIAEEMTEVLVIRVIDQMQALIRRGKLRELLNQQRKYVDINDQNEIVEITRVVAQVMIDKVLPQIQPDVEKFLIYNIDQVLRQSKPYQQLQLLPGVRSLQAQVMTQLIGQIYERTLEVLQSFLQEDPVFDELLENLVVNLSQTTNKEMKAGKSLDNIENLLTDLLEEVKINYVNELSQTDIDRIIEETRILRQAHRLNNPNR
ncbi:MAG: hypothetical protein VKJ02_15070 [Snowella sp.]|nr:hypothetical protein [Snowella sp.]